MTPPLAEAYRRHDLLDVAPQAWAALLIGRPDLAGVPHVSTWAGMARPIILRRCHPGEGGLVPAGLPLPPRDGKRRIDLALPAEAVRPRAPVALAATRSVCPEPWTATLEEIVALGEAHNLVPRPFGSLLWQCVTGLPYLSPTSDLDLLWPVAGPVPRALLDGLADIQARAPMRIDGEILLAGGGGVNWRELHDAAPGQTVLVKYRDRLALREAASILAGDPE